MNPLPRDAVIVRRLGVLDYGTVWAAMRHFTDTRDADSADELWLVEHPPVYTVGQRGGPHGHQVPPQGPLGIPLVHSDRGGDITYHGPGQLVAYTLIDLRRRALGIRALVQLLEQCAMGLLGSYGLRGERRAGAPGVYVGDAKIAQLGLRVRSGGSYHGLSFNVAMDLTPFAHIDPCGYRGLAVTDLRRLLPAGHDEGRLYTDVRERLTQLLTTALGYNSVRAETGLPPPGGGPA